ncbi:MAG: DNA-binding response regulator, partial [Actinomycetota bacterium]|nr:DNA-binding response regulator [Actinomycetota bacterium]
MADVLRRGLEAARYAVDLAVDGEEALAKTLAVDYDAVVLDILLPG